MEKLISLNSIQAKGKRPFALQVSFQAFGSDEKTPVDQGTLQYWWGGDQGHLLKVSSPMLGDRDQLVLAADQTVEARREMWELATLFRLLLSPMAEIEDGKPVDVIKRQQGAVSLRCLSQKASDGTVITLATCLDDNDTVREIGIGAFLQTVVLNRTGVFAGTHVSMHATLISGRQRAMTVAITSLQAFDPAKSEVSLTRSLSVEKGALATVTVSGKVIAGHRIKGGAPIYPFEAKQRHLEGTVILAARINRQGDIALLTPVVDPDALLTAAAIKAVETWKYSPYLLDGEPVEVNTTITVNFNLSSSFYFAH